MGLASALISHGVVGICFALLGCRLPFVSVAAIQLAIPAIFFGVTGLCTEGHEFAVGGRPLERTALGISGKRSD
jgi:hypothetical protein